eukprot:gene19825-biopygen5529
MCAAKAVDEIDRETERQQVPQANKKRALTIGGTACPRSVCAPEGTGRWRGRGGLQAIFGLGWRGRGAGMSCSLWGFQACKAFEKRGKPPERRRRRAATRAAASRTSSRGAGRGGGASKRGDGQRACGQKAAPRTASALFFGMSARNGHPVEGRPGSVQQMAEEHNPPGIRPRTSSIEMPTAAETTSTEPVLWWVEAPSRTCQRHKKTCPTCRCRPSLPISTPAGETSADHTLHPATPVMSPRHL